MSMRLSWNDGASALAFFIAVLAIPSANALAGHGGHGGGHGGGHAAGAPRVSAAHGGFKAPRMPRIKAPARSSFAHTQTHANHSSGGAGHAQTHANSAQISTRSARNPAMKPSAVARSAATGPASSGNRSAMGTVAPGSFKPLAVGASPINPSGLNANTYTYGYGSGARRYRAYGYGAGYRNRYYGRRYGYGRSQGYNRAIIARLRSVQMQLARIDHDYQGHRVRAMHQVSMAIRQLSHRSMIYSGVGFAPGMNNGRAMGLGQGGMGGRGGVGRGGGLGGRAGAGRMTQGQSDARMSHSLRTLQGVGMQLSSQGSFATGGARARGHVAQAVHELSVALSIR